MTSRNVCEHSCTSACLVFLSKNTADILFSLICPLSFCPFDTTWLIHWNVTTKMGGFFFLHLSVLKLYGSDSDVHIMNILNICHDKNLYTCTTATVSTTTANHWSSSVTFLVNLSIAQPNRRWRRELQRHYMATSCIPIAINHIMHGPKWALM